MSETLTDRIERSVVIRAPRARVWQALTDTREFGEWFGVNIKGTFAPGAKARGRVTGDNRQRSRSLSAAEEDKAGWIFQREGLNGRWPRRQRRIRSHRN